MVMIGDDLIQWDNGILSGWKFTSMMDSIVNLAQAYACAYMYDLPEPLAMAMGDDYLEAASSAGSSVSRVEAMMLNGYDIKPGDSTVGDQGEFIRYVIGRDKVFGYPMRSVAAYIWKADVTGYETIGLDNLNEVISQYCVSVGRGLDVQPCKDVAFRGLKRVWGANPYDPITWAASPASFGGGGMWEWSDKFSIRYWDIEAPKKRTQEKILYGDHVTKGLEKWGVVNTDNVVADTLTIRSAKPVITPGKVKGSRRIPKDRPMPSGLMEDSVFDERPRWKYDYSTMYAWGEIVRVHVENGDWGWFSDKFEPTTKSALTMAVLVKSSNNRVVSAWLNGKFPFSPPKFSKYNSAVISTIHRRCVNWAMADCLSLSHIRWSVLLGYCMAAEKRAFEVMAAGIECFNWTP
jgi:hypothetical protein